jgi:hypothetical protein
MAQHFWTKPRSRLAVRGKNTSAEGDFSYGALHICFAMRSANPIAQRGLGFAQPQPDNQKPRWDEETNPQERKLKSVCFVFFRPRRAREHAFEASLKSCAGER